MLRLLQGVMLIHLDHFKLGGLEQFAPAYLLLSEFEFIQEEFLELIGLSGRKLITQHVQQS